MFKSKQLWSILLAVFLFISPANAQIFPGPQASGGGSSASTLPATVTLGADAAEISSVVSDQTYHAHALILSAGATGNFYAALNGDTSDSGYNRRILYGIGSATLSAGVSGGFLGATVTAGQWVDIHMKVSRIYDGTNTIFLVHFQAATPGSVSNGIIYKSASGDVPLTQIGVRAYTATDVGEDSYLEFL